MARNQRARAHARLKDAERKAKRNGQVVVTFKDPCHSVPWYRASNSEDHVRVFSNAVCEVVPTPKATMIRVSQQTEHGDIVRLYDWAAIEDVVIVPPLPKPEPKEDPLA